MAAVEQELVEARKRGTRALALQDPYLVAKDHDLGLTVSHLIRRSQSEDEAENRVEEGEQHRGILGTVRRRMTRVSVPLKPRNDGCRRPLIRVHD